jgi:hypothetical protein
MCRGQRVGLKAIALDEGDPLGTQTYASRRLLQFGPVGPQRATPGHGLWFLLLAVVYVLGSAHPALAGALDLVLICPGVSSGEPEFRDQGGRKIPILIPGERAIAEKLCNLGVAPSGVDVNVTVTNNGANTIYVAFTNYSTQLPGPITWSNCSVVNNQVVIPGAGTTCNAVVPATAGMTRFCAFTTQVPAGQSPNCNLAQSQNQTMIETNFGTGANGVCYPTTLSSCVWYDLSVISQNCTTSAWTLNYCQNTGGASYNLPVSIASSGEPTYTCQGPPSNVPYGNANYPSNCGNPVAGCVGNNVSCNNAYFFPTPSPQPNSEAQPGQTLVITFLAGQ